MNNVADIIEKRLTVLRDSLIKLQNNANAHIGAIQELERLLKEYKDGDGVQTGGEERPVTRDLPSNLD